MKGMKLLPPSSLRTCKGGEKRLDAGAAIREQMGEALALINEAAACAERGKLGWQAEVNRRKGELLLGFLEPDLAAAEVCLCLAHALAREQDAKFREFRAAISLARLWRDRGRRAEAHSLLAPVYTWFTEGFDMPDLKDAKALKKFQ
jgi:predicted ATPase